MQSEIRAEWLGYIESAISLRLWIYRIENLSLVCLLLQCTTQKSANMALWPKEVSWNTKTWKQEGKLRHSSQVTSEIADVLQCVRTSRYDHYMPGASIQILRCLEKDLLFLKIEIKWSLKHAFHLLSIWNKVHLIGDVSILLTGADYRTTTPPMKNIARNK